MDIIALIEETIEECKSCIEDEEYLYKANSYDLSLNIDSFKKVKDLSINTVIKDFILYYCINVPYKEYKILNEKLDKTDFQSLYDVFIKHHTPTMMELLEVVEEEEDQTAYTTVLEERSFRVLGIYHLYDKTASNEVRQEIVAKEIAKQDKKNMLLLFANGFLDDLLPESLEERHIKNIKNAICNTFENIYSSFIFDQRRSSLFDPDKNPSIDSSILQQLEEMVIDKQERDSFFKKWIPCIEKARKLLISIDKKYKKQQTSIVHALEKARTYIEDKEHLAENIDKINFTALALVDEDLYLEVFKLALEEQEKRYQKALREEEESKLQDENILIDNILQKYKIVFKTLSEEIKSLLIQDINIDLLDKNMRLLHIDNKDNLTVNIFKFLLNTPVKEMNHYGYLLNKGYLSKQTFFDYIDGENDIEYLNNNASMILSQNISSQVPNYDENILFLDANELKLNSQLLSWYKKKTTDNIFNYLYSSDAYDTLDILIENDLDLALLDNHKLSLEQIDAFRKRLQISTSVGIDIYTKSGNVNRSFLLGKGFYCEEEKLDEYMLHSSLENEDIMNELKLNKLNHINENIMNLEVVQKLEVYKRDDDLAYVIDDIIISRPKVMRNLTYFYEKNKLNDDTVIQSIIYNSNFNDEEIQTIQMKMQPQNKVQKLGGGG